VPYRFLDKRVKTVADFMGGLKRIFPETMQLHQILYDSQNIVARYHNKINQHLWEKENLFKEYKDILDGILKSVSHGYSTLFLEAVELANKKRVQPDWLYKKHQVKFFLSEELQKAKKNLEGLLRNFEKEGLSTGKLYLKSWFSMRDSQNTSGGKNE
jgi:hypothetical protein